jgi:hypothetical protein
VRLFAFYLGLPDDPDAEELARRLRRLNQADELTRRCAKRELREGLDALLADPRARAA